MITRFPNNRPTTNLTHASSAEPSVLPDPRGVETGDSRARVLLVDDHPVLRHGLARLINDQPDMLVCGEADSAPAALKAVAMLRPALVMLDLTLGDISGLDLCKQLHDQHPDSAVLVLSMHDESLYAERALRAGAVGYVMKHEPPDNLLSAMRRVLSGDVHVSERISSRIVQSLARARSQDSSTAPLARLSDRELEVFRYIGHGLGVRMLAEKLCLSPKTVETHKDHIKRKLGLRSSAELLQYAIEARDAAL